MLLPDRQPSAAEPEPEPAPGPEPARPDRLWTAMVALTCAVASLLAYFSLVTNSADPDMFWHIATGRWIVEHRTIPTHDVFSWYGVAHGSRWLPQEWLSDVLFFAVHRLAGFPGLYAFTSLLAGVAFLLAYALVSRRTGRRTAALVVALLLSLGVLPYVSARPQMLTYCMLLGMLYCFERGWLWAAVPIVAVGVNLHGGVYPVYLVLIAFYTLPQAPAVLAASAACVLLTPGGAALLAVPFRALLDHTHMVQEFAPTTLTRYPVDFVTVLGVLVLLARGKRPIALRDGLVALTFTALAFTAWRQLVFVYLIVIPVLAPYLFGTVEEAPPKGPGRRLDLAVAALLALAVAGLGCCAVTLPLSVDHGYPRAALEYIGAHHLTHILNDYGDGGYFIFNGVAPFIDGRGDPFLPHSTGGPDLFADAVAALQARTDLAPLLRKYGFEWVVTSKSSALYHALEHSTLATVVYTDSAYAVLRVNR